MPLKTPDFTPEAIVALALGVVTNCIVLFGLNLTDSKKAAVSGLVSAVVLGAFLIHSAIVRHGRAVGNTKR